jgi:hypothetical protein
MFSTPKIEKPIALLNRTVRTSSDLYEPSPHEGHFLRSPNGCLVFHPWQLTNWEYIVILHNGFFDDPSDATSLVSLVKFMTMNVMGN